MDKVTGIAIFIMVIMTMVAAYSFCYAEPPNTAPLAQACEDSGPICVYCHRNEPRKSEGPVWVSKSCKRYCHKCHAEGTW